MLGLKKNPRKRPFMALNDGGDSSDIPCPQCGNKNLVFGSLFIVGFYFSIIEKDYISYIIR